MSQGLFATIVGKKKQSILTYMWHRIGSLLVERFQLEYDQLPGEYLSPPPNNSSSNKPLTKLQEVNKPPRELIRECTVVSHCLSCEDVLIRKISFIKMSRTYFARARYVKIYNIKNVTTYRKTWQFSHRVQ